MNPTGTVVSRVYAIAMLGCALSAGFDVFAFAFGIGDGGGRIGPLVGAFMIATLAGGVGLTIAALGSWSGWRAFSLLAFVSALLVLPAAMLYAWQSVPAFWHNSHLGYHYGFWAWASAIAPPPLGIAIVILSWLRFRRLQRQAYSSTSAHLN